MIWVILCKDKPNSFKKRMGIIDEHRRYLASNPIKTLISGPLTDISGKVMNGSFFMVEADTENEVKEFQSNDPMFKAGVWDQVTISPFNKRVDNLSKI
ncbi:YciI family protein [Alphaproteobacteria bacterium]|nr:YciI family protein [Alphaproteobacteria bacterium]